MILVLHYLSAAVGLFSGAMSAYYGLEAVESLDPNLDAGSRFVATFLAYSSRPDDYIGEGWAARKAQYAWQAAGFAAFICFILTFADP